MHCPVGAARDRFNLGLGARPAIYIEYPQAVPLAYIIDRDTCIGCGLCETDVYKRQLPGRAAGLVREGTARAPRDSKRKVVS